MLTALIIGRETPDQRPGALYVSKLN
jgi:hypothetical protein